MLQDKIAKLNHNQRAKTALNKGKRLLKKAGLEKLIHVDYNCTITLLKADNILVHCELSRKVEKII